MRIAPSRRSFTRSYARICTFLNSITHALQGGDAFFDGRMCLEKLGDEAAFFVCAEGIRDEKVRGSVRRALHRRAVG